MSRYWVASACSTFCFPWRGKRHPLQRSCLGDPMDRGAWWATVHGVAKSWTWLSDWARTHALTHSLTFCVLDLFSLVETSGCSDVTPVLRFLHRYGCNVYGPFQVLSALVFSTYRQREKTAWRRCSWWSLRFSTAPTEMPTLNHVRPERTAVLSADPSSFGSTIHEQLKWRVETIVTWYGAHCSIFILFSRMRALLILFYTSMPKFWVHKLFLLFFCWNFSFWIQEFQKKFC